jgi:hypothetical protein
MEVVTEPNAIVIFINIIWQKQGLSEKQAGHPKQKFPMKIDRFINMSAFFQLLHYFQIHHHLKAFGQKQRY